MKNNKSIFAKGYYSAYSKHNPILNKHHYIEEVICDEESYARYKKKLNQRSFFNKEVVFAAILGGIVLCLI